MPAPWTNSVGLLYQNGDGVGQNSAKAAECFAKAAAEGFGAAQDNFGLLLEFGRGVKQDKEQAGNWFQKAVGQGYEPAKEHLTNLSSPSQQILDQTFREVKFDAVAFTDVLDILRNLTKAEIVVD